MLRSLTLKYGVHATVTSKRAHQDFISGGRKYPFGRPDRLNLADANSGIAHVLEGQVPPWQAWEGDLLRLPTWPSRGASSV